MQQINLEKTKQYAIKCHSETNHFYDSHPYSSHLEMTYNNGLKYIHLIPESKQTIILSACWTHDLIEDTRQTYNDVKKVCGEEIAELTYALTNEKGRNRKERENEKYFTGIKNTPYATFVKLCDRLANIQYSVDNGNRMLEMYKKEYANFKKYLYVKEYDEMFNELENLLNI